MMRVLTYIEEFNTFSICLRLAIATLFGGCIGLERGAHGQPAGIRTFSLVSLGACLSMITDEYLVLAYQSGDPARLAAQVISGIVACILEFYLQHSAVPIITIHLESKTL